MSGAMRSSRRPGVSSFDSTLVRRNFHFHPARLNSDSRLETSWLDYLVCAAGSFAGRLLTRIVTSVGSQSSVIQTKVYPVGVQQQLIVAVDDLLIAHPLTYKTSDVYKGDTFFFPYQEVRVSGVSATIAPSAQIEHRGGMIAAVFIPLTLEIARNARYAMASSLQPRVIESSVDNWRTKGQAVLDEPDVEGYDGPCLAPLDYDRILAMPGAVVASADRQITVSCPPSDLVSRWHSLAPVDLEDSDNYQFCRGALPFAQLCIAYQNYAGAEPDPTQLYSATEAQFEISITASTNVRSPGRCWVRSDICTIQDPDLVVTTLTGNFPSVTVDIPLSGYSGSALPPSAFRHLLPDSPTI